MVLIEKGVGGEEAVDAVHHLVGAGVEWGLLLGRQWQRFSITDGTIVTLILNPGQDNFDMEERREEERGGDEEERR